MAEKKLPGENLDPDIKKVLDNMKPEELRVKVAEVALYKQAREDIMKADPDVIAAREKKTEVEADYKDEIKGAKNQIAYIKYLLEQAGKL